jgi:hypothetical protein
MGVTREGPNLLLQRSLYVRGFVILVLQVLDKERTGSAFRIALPNRILLF